MNSVNYDNKKIEKILLAFDSLSVYRNLLEDEVMIKLYKLLNCFNADGLNSVNQAIKLYNDFYFSLIKSTPSNSFKQHIIDRIIFDENPFSARSESITFESIENVFVKAASNDLYYLQLISEVSPFYLKEFLQKSLSLSDFETSIVKNLPEWSYENDSLQGNTHTVNDAESICSLFSTSPDWSECVGALSGFYHETGTGIFARFKAFIWEQVGNTRSLKGVENPDPITLSELIGYDLERSEVINNTLKFLDGYPANNILLYGDRGTGKSSTVKAILNEYYKNGLRIIEVPKNNLIDFPEIVRNLNYRNQKFIIFVDDIAFEDNEENYTALKAVLEGGLESKPKNVLIYATSNRRHLIKEKFSDRLGLMSDNRDDEIRAADSIQEKLSLADRFGITVIFSSPDKQKFLEIVEGIAFSRGLKVEKDILHKEALKWELWYNGRSPRTARQFVDWLEGELACGR